MNRLKKQLKEKKLDNAYLIYGQEDFLKDYYTSLIINMVCDNFTKDFNLLKIVNQKIDYNTIEEFSAQYPVMSDKKLLILKNTGIFKKATDEDKKFWMGFFDDFPVYLIIVFIESEIDKRNALYKLINKSHTAVEFKYQEKHDLTSWITKILNSYSKEMSKPDIEYLIETVGLSMLNIKSEIEKLVMYAMDKKVITKEDIDFLVTAPLENRIFNMIDAIIDEKNDPAIAMFEDLKLLKEEPVAIIAVIFSQYSRLKKIKMLLGKYQISDIAKEVGIKEYFVKKYISRLKNINIDYIDSVIYECFSADNAIKSGKCEKWTAVETLIAKCLR